VELGTWCWPRVVLIEKRPLTESERSSMNRAGRGRLARDGFGVLVAPPSVGSSGRIPSHGISSKKLGSGL
jgi:hypothetical protein